MKKNQKEILLLIDILCFVLWTVLAVFRVIEKNPNAWLYCGCAAVWAVTSVLAFIRYRKEKQTKDNDSLNKEL